MLGQRLRQMRLVRGLSLDALAAEMGGVVTKQAISKYEKGQATPSPRVLNQLAKSLGVKAAALWAAPSIEVEFIAYRKGSRLRVRDKERVESVVRQSLETRIRLQELNAEPDHFALPVLHLQVDNVDGAEMAAARMRTLWKLGMESISSVTDVLEEHGVQVLAIEADEKFDGISAVALNRAKKPVAAATVTRQGLPRGRQRLNLAHELGHLVMSVSKDVEEERAAFRFAGAFLAPAEVLRREVGLHRTYIGLDELVMLKGRFGISIQALLYRMKDLGIISPTYFEGWNIQIRGSGLRKNEPGDQPAEESQWLRRGVLRALAEGRLVQDEAESILKEAVEKERPLSLTERRAFMKLPLEERRRILAEQAMKLSSYYEEDKERIHLQGGDVVEY